MRRFALLLLLAWPAAAAERVYELPEEPKTPVLTIDYRGGFGPPRKNNDPYLAILADGTLVAEHVEKGTKLSADELQALLRFVIGKHKLMDFDRKAVEAKARSDVYITDQSDTIVTIAIKGRKKKVKYNASTWAAQQFPKVKELQGLEAVRKRLHRIWCCALLGGEAEAKKVLDLVNKEFGKQHPKVAPLTLDDLDRVYHQEKGLRRVLLARWHSKGAEGAYVNLPKQGKPSVETWVQPR